MKDCQECVDKLLKRLHATETALRNLLARADAHWQDKGSAWHEQETARELLANKVTLKFTK